MLVFLDAERAFSNVSRTFIKTQLEYLEFGHCTLHTVAQIYSSQQTKLLINNDLPNTLLICKGTQCSWLSFLLFIISLEILLNQIRHHPNIKGLKTKGVHCKLQAFADDLMIILEEPQEPISILYHLLSTYGHVSGFKINNQKTYRLTKI